VRALNACVCVCRAMFNADSHLPSLISLSLTHTHKSYVARDNKTSRERVIGVYFRPYHFQRIVHSKAFSVTSGRPLFLLHFPPNTHHSTRTRVY
jgi:hypothetical protein